MKKVLEMNGNGEFKLVCAHCGKKFKSSCKDGRPLYCCEKCYDEATKYFEK